MQNRPDSIVILSKISVIVLADLLHCGFSLSVAFLFCILQVTPNLQSSEKVTWAKTWEVKFVPYTNFGQTILPQLLTVVTISVHHTTIHILGIRKSFHNTISKELFLSEITA